MSLAPPLALASNGIVVMIAFPEYTFDPPGAPSGVGSHSKNDGNTAFANCCDGGAYGLPPLHAVAIAAKATAKNERFNEITCMPGAFDARGECYRSFAPPCTESSMR